MNTTTESKPAQPLACVDEFVGAVQWSETRTVLAHRREQGWREYVRLRTWNRHREKGCWYPSRRFYIIPIERVDELVCLLLSALAGDQEEKPDWLVAHEHIEDQQLRAIGASDDMSAEEIERMKKNAAKIRRQQH